MSQLYLGASSSPSVPTSFAGDSGTATPAANVLTIDALDTQDNNDNGVVTEASGSTVTLLLTNRLQSTVTTIGATTADIITLDLGASAAVYRFSFEVVGRDTATGDAIGYSIKATLKTDGAAATEIDADYQDKDDDTSLAAASVDVIASGNNAIVRVTGVAGQTISHGVVGYYNFV